MSSQRYETELLQAAVEPLPELSQWATRAADTATLKRRTRRGSVECLRDMLLKLEEREFQGQGVWGTTMTPALHMHECIGKVKASIQQQVEEEEDCISVRTACWISCTIILCAIVLIAFWESRMAPARRTGH